MNAFVWDERYATSEKTVDQEHQELARIVGQVANLPPDGQAADLLARLTDYAAAHFGHEEELMLAVGCDRRHLEEHRAIHRDFLRQLERICRLPAADAAPEPLLHFLADWLSYHILGTDQSMARQVRRIRAGMAPAAAYEVEREMAADPATSALGDALHSLYHVIVERNQGLVEVNIRLEKLVDERTRALSTANRRLRADQARLQAALSTAEEAQNRLLASEQQRAEAQQGRLQRLMAQIIDGDPVPTLVIDAEHRITHWNKACAMVTGLPADAMVGSRRQWEAFYPSERPIMADLIVDGALDEHFERYYDGNFQHSAVISGAFEAEVFFAHMGERGRWLHFTAAPLRDDAGAIIGAIETLQDVSERRQAEQELQRHQSQLERQVEERTAQLAEANRRLAEDIRRREAAEAELQRRYDELDQLNRKLSQAQQQLVQSEKMASIGQLAAGVAHEINNPIGYVQSNLGVLEKYVADLLRLLAAYEAAAPAWPSAGRAELDALRQEVDLAFVKDDIPLLIGESKEGIHRVKKIVQDLKDFSHMGGNQVWQWADLHQGIDSTLNIVANEIKYKADVIKEYGVLPPVQCLPSQLNQVYMNLLVNAAHAAREPRGRIVIRSGSEGETVWLEFSDDGIGIPKEIQARIFDPFFTTKPVGKGTGLGLSLSYGIIQKHDGRIEVTSEVGKGTTFRITLPVRHAGAAADAPAAECLAAG